MNPRAADTQGSSPAGASVRDLDDGRPAERIARNVLLLRLLLGFSAVLTLSFALLVGSGVRAYGIDRELSGVWWSHNAEYDCCWSRNEHCRAGVDALIELRQRLAQRSHSTREQLGALVASGLGLADLDVSQGAASSAEVESWFASCRALH